jgi:quercetin dioxygenase-like cupin family protein
MSTLSPRARQALMARIAQTHRFPDFEAPIAELVELPLTKVAELLLRVDAKASWEPGPIPGIELFHFSGGPSVQNAITGFVRLAPGTAFPHHAHIGLERVLVIQGALKDSDGTRHMRGAAITMAAGTAHAFAVDGDIPLIYVVVVEQGVIIGGQRIGPGDPRG